MVKDSNYIATTLCNFTNAPEVEIVVSDSRYMYKLTFKNKMGWEWLAAQVEKVSRHTSVRLEPYRIVPKTDGTFVIEVREMGRRENIDNNQTYWGDY